MRSSLAGLQAYYERQFEEDGSTILFRMKGTGPAYKVSADERKSYLDETSYAVQRGRFWLIGIMITGILATVLFSVAIDRGDDQLGIYLGSGLSTAAGLAIWLRMLGMPNTRMKVRLIRRLPVKPALDREAIRRQKLSQISYGQLALIPLLSLVFLIQRDADPFSGWGRLLWLLPISITLVAAVQAYRKWRYS